MEPLWCSAARCACLLSDAGRTADGRERRGVRRVRPQRVFCGYGHWKGRAVQAQERCTKVAGHYPGPVRAENCGWPEGGLAATVPLFGCEAAPIPAALVLVSTKRRGMSGDGERAGRETQHLLERVRVVVAAGASAGIGLEALPPVREAIGSGFTTKTITLSCGKLTTGVTCAAMVFNPHAAQSEEP